MGKAIAKYGRNRFIIATKAPAFNIGPKGEFLPANGKREAILKVCDEALKNLQIDCIDIFYMHRMDESTPIEETVQTFKELINIGKIKAYGLSEAGPNTIRRAHSVHPCACV